MNKHRCNIRLNSCFDHPRWHVWHYPSESAWRVSSPLLQEGRSFPTHAEAVQYATSRARAEALAAVQSAEGQAAS